MAAVALLPGAYRSFLPERCQAGAPAAFDPSVAWQLASRDAAVGLDLDLGLRRAACRVRAIVFFIARALEQLGWAFSATFTHKWQ